MSTIAVVLLNSLAWLIIHLGVAWLSGVLPPDFVREGGWLYRTRAWERDGRAYDRLLGVRRWKRHLPDGASWFRGGFPKRRLAGRDAVYLERFVLETRRAELCHWLALLIVPTFFLWNPPYVAVWMVPYGLLTNLPCIVAQRFNRPRLRRLAAAAGPP